jgi:hypothetical protein
VCVLLSNRVCVLLSNRVCVLLSMLMSGPQNATVLACDVCRRVVSPEGTYTLQAESEFERAEWIAALQVRHTGLTVPHCSTSPLKQSMRVGACCIAIIHRAS